MVMHCCDFLRFEQLILFYLNIILHLIKQINQSSIDVDESGEQIKKEIIVLQIFLRPTIYGLEDFRINLKAQH